MLLHFEPMNIILLKKGPWAFKKLGSTITLWCSIFRKLFTEH